MTARRDRGGAVTAARVGITMGDPAGVGPEVVLKACDAVASEDGIRTVIFGDPGFLTTLAAELGLRPPRDVVSCGTVSPQLRPGRPHRGGGRVALDCLSTAADLVRAGDVAALVTAPVDKAVIARIQPGFKGHTDFLAAHAGVRDPLMVFAGIRPAVALLTAHLPLATAVASARRQRVLAALLRLDEGWRRWFGASPRIAVAGLNPHAGEHGLLGTEDQLEVLPAVVEAREGGIDAHGPFPADGLIRHVDADVILALYHDQGTIIAKRGPVPSVNTTFGLPYPRTSPDHGVAYDIAARRIADPEPMIAAVRLAVAMAERAGDPRRG